LGIKKNQFLRVNLSVAVNAQDRTLPQLSSEAAVDGVVRSDFMGDCKSFLRSVKVVELEHLGITLTAALTSSDRFQAVYHIAHPHLLALQIVHPANAGALPADSGLAIRASLVIEK
jgi:hypothetical protein